MPKSKLVAECLQCQGDELLKIRESASKYTDILGVLQDHYRCAAGQRKPGIEAADIIDRLAKAEKDQRRLCAMLRSDAERRAREAGELIAAIRFVSRVCNREHGSVHVHSGKMMIEMSDVLQLIIDRLLLIVASDKGLLEGLQPQNDVNFLDDCWIEEPTR